MNDRIEMEGLTFRAETVADDDNPRPWDECDGHGSVREISHNSITGRLSKSSGERVLYDGGRREYSFAYDWQEAVLRARAEGWGVSAETLAKLEADKGRTLTPGELAHAAVQQDFDFLRRWCAGQWAYVGVVVTLLDTDGEDTSETESLWRIESDSGEYLVEVAADLAHEICARVGKRRKFIEEGARRIRVRA